MDEIDPKSEIDFIKNIVEKSNQRIDAQGFHVVHWGLIVLVWYPIGNWLQNENRIEPLIWLGIGALVLGTVLSFVRGWRAHNRIPGENTFITRQLMKVFFGCIGGGIVLSAICPGTGWIDGPDVPILWGLIYANLAFMIGVVYSRDFVIAGVFIFAGAIAAMFLQAYQGYILGPVMGLGMIVPGLRAEARVKQILRVSAGEAAA